MKFKTKICYRCSTPIESKEEGKRLKTDFEYGSSEWFCNDCAKDYREDDYRIDDEEDMEEEFDFMSLVKGINHDKQKEMFLEEIDKTYTTEISTNKRFITRLEEELNTKLKEGYPSPQLLFNTIQTWKYDGRNGQIDLTNMSNLHLVINVIFKNIDGYRDKTIAEMKNDINYRKNENDYDYFLDEPYEWTSKGVKVKEKTNTSKGNIDKPIKENTKSNEPKNKPRRFPTTIEVEEINDEGEFIMNSIDLLKKGKLNYIVYGYLQEKSDGDKENFDKFRKVYIKDINHSQIAKECSKVSRNTVPKALSKLEELGLLSSDTFKDDNGEYKKLYNLDGKYVILDFNKRPIQRLTTCIKSEGVSLFLILKHYCRQYGKCTLTQEQLFEKLGYANCDKNRDTLNLFLETLEGIGCIKVERIKNEKKQNKNIYYCLV